MSSKGTSYPNFRMCIDKEVTLPIYFSHYVHSILAVLILFNSYVYLYSFVKVSLIFIKCNQFH